MPGDPNPPEPPGQPANRGAQTEKPLPDAIAARRLQPITVGYALAAPLLALVVASGVAFLALWAIGGDVGPAQAISDMFSYATSSAQIYAILDRATPLYLAAVAVAIGFRMGLFNIGVEGQYRIAALIAAAVGGAVRLPAVLEIPLLFVVAIATGAAWSGIAGGLKVTRGVSEVISTIMLNNIANYLSAFLLSSYFVFKVAGSNNQATKPIPSSGHVGALDGFLHALGIHVPPSATLTGFLPIAIVVGIGYGLVISRTRFGFELRASGLNPMAARASGVDARRMTFVTMLLSGAVAGLVGLPEVLGSAYKYSLGFASGYGILGIGVALLGRNGPVGMGLAALLFSFLDIGSQALDLDGIPPQIATIMEGVIVLAVVIAYEVVRRARLRFEQQRLARTAATPPPVPAGAPA